MWDKEVTLYGWLATYRDTGRVAEWDMLLPHASTYCNDGLVSHMDGHGKSL
jgi:hypothetical protein